MFVITESVELPDPVTVLGVKLALEFCGRPLTVNETLPLNPTAPVTATVYRAVDPRLTVWLAGDAEIVKSPAGAAFTTSVTVVEWVRLPLVPVIVKGYVPVGVELLVVTDIVEEPEPASEVGLYVALAPEGRPLALNETVPVNPFNAAMLAV